MTKKKTEDTEIESDDPPTPNKYAKDPSKPIKLIKWGAAWCGHCVSMAKSRQLEKLAEKHDDVEVIVIDVEKDEEMADQYDVKSMPALFFEDKDGYILAEHDGGLADSKLEKLYLQAKAKLAEG